MISDWIYHERQDASLCGQHALNNLVQSSIFTAGDLAEVAQQLDEMELSYMAANNEGGARSKDYLNRINEGSGNVDEQGNFSIQVLRAALQRRYNLSLPAIGQNDLDKSRDITSYFGFICNRASHWFAIRKISSEFWNLNSTLDKPNLISHFRLATELEALQQDGYAVFVVPEDKLPVPDRSTGAEHFWWRISDLLKGTSNNIDNHIKAEIDWNEIGSGRRLDGRSPADDEKLILSEKEMIERAIQASMLPQLPDEPSLDCPGVVTIQFRFPSGKKQQRRFLSNQHVEVVYSYCMTEAGGRNVELRYGFPPRDLSHARSKSRTIGEANLNGESIQARIK